MKYRFEKWKDANWNSYERQKARYEIIAPLLGKSCVGAEIGVYKGGFGEFLLQHCSKLYLVDPWYRNGGFWKSDIANDSRVDTVIELLSIYKQQIEQGLVELVVEYSEPFLRSVPDDYFDFVYIDSSHAYKQTREELKLAAKKVKKGKSGVILGDDYDPRPESRQHGVYLAVNEFIEETGAKMVLDKGRQWGLRLNRGVT